MAPSSAGPDGIGPAPSAAADAPSAEVQCRLVQVTNKRGLHARAAAKFVKEAERFTACVNVRKNGNLVSARSIMGLMMLGAGPGATLSLEAEGWDAREALDALSALVEAGFHEQD
jgi:phosphocarrier protein HPr